MSEGHALATLLEQSRTLCGISLRSAASQADISAGYLSQLEAGEVDSPSPRVLYRLAQVYVASGISYYDLMLATGYVLPVPESGETPTVRNGLVVPVLSEDERAALLEYLHWYRYKRGRRKP